MLITSVMSPAIVEAVNKSLNSDPVVKEIDHIQKEIHNKEMDIIDLEAKLSVIQKKRPKVKIRWRDSIRWCFEVDAANPKYFLKNVSGVCNCVSFKHKIETTADIRNKIATTLSIMFNQKLIGRIEHDNTFYYGMTEFFKSDLVTLKDKYEKNVEKLML